jgi:hypothetical protein
MTTHQLIAGALRNAYQLQPMVGWEILKDPDTNVILRKVFSNYRRFDKEEAGLRLTHEAQTLFRIYFQQWPVHLIADNFASREVLFLDRTCAMPWYVEIGEHDGYHLKLTLYLMERDFAMKAKLVGHMNSLMTAFISP